MKQTSQAMKDFVNGMRKGHAYTLDSVLTIARWAVIVCLVALIMSALFAYRAISLAGEQKIVTYVVERNGETGTVLSVQPLKNGGLSENDAWVMADLQNFIELIRTSSIDRATIGSNRKKASYFLVAGSKAEGQVKRWIQEDNIQKRLINNKEYVVPTSFRKRKIGRNHYVFNWDENVKDVNTNKSLRREQRRAEFIVKRLQSNNPEVLEENASGTYIDQIETDLIEVIRK